MSKQCNQKNPKAFDYSYMCNPYTGRWILKDGKVAKQLTGGVGSCSIVEAPGVQERRLNRMYSTHFQDVVMDMERRYAPKPKKKTKKQYGILFPKKKKKQAPAKPVPMFSSMINMLIPRRKNAC